MERDRLASTASPGFLPLFHFRGGGDKPLTVRSCRSGIRTRRRLSHRVRQFQIRHVFHGGIRQHDYRLLPRDDSFFWRMALPVPADFAVRLDALYSRGGLRPGGSRLDRAWRPVYHCVWADCIAGAWSRPVWHWNILWPARRHRIYPGAILVPAEDCDFPVYLRLGARHASAFPLRSVDEFRVEAASPAFDLERGDYQPGDRADTTMRSESTEMTRGTNRGTR